MITIKKFVVFLSLVYLASGAEKKLPDYIKTCSRSDPNVDACIVKHAEEALPFILKGDKAYRLPSLQPYKIPLIDIDQGANFRLKLINCVTDGFQDVTFEKAHADFNARSIQFSGRVPRINILSDYDIKGRILVLPIVGSGPANLTFVNVAYNYKINYDLEEKNGKQYMKVKTTKLTIDPERSWYKLDNLFNGDKRLGPEMQNFLDENWKEVSKDLNPALEDTVDAVITNILTTIVTVIPYDQVFPK